MFLDRIAQRYGKLPTEILSLPLDEYELLMVIVEAGVDQDDRDNKKLQRDLKKKSRRGRR